MSRKTLEDQGQVLVLQVTSKVSGNTAACVICGLIRLLAKGAGADIAFWGRAGRQRKEFSQLRRKDMLKI